MKRAASRGTRQAPVPGSFRRAIRILFLALNTILVLLFLFAYLAAYIHPRYFWTGALIAIGLPYLSIAVVISMLIVLAVRHWPLVVVHLVLVALILIRFAPHVGTAAVVDADEETLVVMSYNSPRYGPSADELAEGLLNFIRQQDPDMIAFQESQVWPGARPGTVHATVHIAPIIDSLGYQALPPAGAGEGYMIQQPVLARVELKEQEQIELRYAPGEALTTHVVRTRFHWEGQDAVIYNLHLRTFGENKFWREAIELLKPRFWIPYLRQYRRNYIIRAWEVEQVRAMIEEETLPVLVCGDINSTPHNWEYRRLSEGLQDAFLVAGSGWGATWHTMLPFVRIDYILASPEWEVLAASVPKTHLSDHLPVRAVLRWRQ